jgi:dinuclear metal center YbgI/SA1388 family protein
MFADGHTVIRMMEDIAPKWLAMEGDPIGLQLGTPDRPVKKVLVALDVTEDVADEAIRLQADMIVAHHAVIYRPVRHLRTDLPAGKLYAKLLKHDIAVYVAHTNLDAAEGGVNDALASALGLTDAVPFAELKHGQLAKLAVFVPKSHHDRVMQAVFDAGAGWIGNYSHCSFNVEGTGTFLAREGANPFLGQVGRLETADEIRLETVVPREKLDRVVQAMLKAHPYEEVAYDIYPLDVKGKTYGIGRVGSLPEPATLAQLAERVKAAYRVSAVRLVGDPGRTVRKVAVLGGSGRSYVADAMRSGADVLVTGDIDHHTAHDALAAGFALIDAGHHIEKLVKPAVAGRLGGMLKDAGYATVAVASEIDTDPFRFA